MVNSTSVSFGLAPEPLKETSNHPQNAPTFAGPLGPGASRILSSNGTSTAFISSSVTVCRSYSFSTQVVPKTWDGWTSTHALVFMKNSVCSCSNVSVSARMSTPYVFKVWSANSSQPAQESS